MLVAYRLLTYLVFLLSPIIILYRVLQNKEDPRRFLEKFTLFSKKRNKGNLIWFHTVSVGEFLSIVPLVEKLEKKKNINQILITSTTLTSAKLFEKFKFKKTVHQFFPLDLYSFSKRFINYWRPRLAIFVDSEVWPIMTETLKKNYVRTILLNARISKKSFKRWYLIKSFSTKIFKNFNYTYPQNIETKKYLIKLGVKNIKLLGNLKFCQKKKNITISNLSKFKNFIDKKRVWCAMSTHDGEEKICIEVQKKLLNKNYNLILIIIPRHTDRLEKIENEIKNMGLGYHKHSSNHKIKKDTKIYLVDTYGEAESFLEYSKLVFIGKSITKKGGQNPIEPARNNCKILHGPHVTNFTELYRLLSKEKISSRVTNPATLQNKIELFLKKKTKTQSYKNKINLIGTKILNKNLNEVFKNI